MFSPDNEILRRAEFYCRAQAPPIKLIEQLGFGQDGYVWSTNRDTALKGFEREENYTRELKCYQRLTELKVLEINEFSVPALHHFDHSLLIVEMSIVFPPFLIDFGKSYLDEKPDYDETTMAEFWQSRQALFDAGEWPIVRGLLNSLESYGIFYLDAKPGNIRFH